MKLTFASAWTYLYRTVEATGETIDFMRKVLCDS